jgi:hypothetical protein
MIGLESSRRCNKKHGIIIILPARRGSTVQLTSTMYSTTLATSSTVVAVATVQYVATTSSYVATTSTSITPRIIAYYYSTTTVATTVGS